MMRIRRGKPVLTGYSGTWYNDAAILPCPHRKKGVVQSTRSVSASIRISLFGLDAAEEKVTA